RIYQDLTKKESVHLANWPKSNEKLIAKSLEQQMALVRQMVSLGLRARTEAKIKVRQPLKELRVKNEELKDEKDLLDLIKEEVNVKEIVFDSKIKQEVELDTKITPKLKEEGQVREIIRYLQTLRKKAGLTPQDKISIHYSGSPQLTKILTKNKTLIQKETRAKDIARLSEKEVAVPEKKLKIDNQELNLVIKKVDKK
ncbi:unnamed protein product, partial [marine sediment metagenome]